MFLTAEKAYERKLLEDIKNNPEVNRILERVDTVCNKETVLIYDMPLQEISKQQLTALGFALVEENGIVHSVSWPKGISLADIVSTVRPCVRRSNRKQNVIIALCLVIIALLLSLTTVGVVIWQTKQVGLVALIDTPKVTPSIPDYDPDAIVPPVDDKVQKLNEKLDKGKMCINMVGRVTFDNCYTAGYVNIVNDEANNYPQFMTLTLDSNGTQIYQSGLIPVGKSVLYANLEIELPAGTYDCTALFSQVDPETNKICGQAAAKVVVAVKN